MIRILMALQVFIVIQAIDSFAQGPPIRRRPVPTTVPDANPVNTVGVYDEVRFAGSSRTLSPGTYLLTTAADLDDRISSVKVPPGMGVAIYEFGKKEGGYGSFTDLLEDCADLSVYGMNDKVSYLIVFSLSRPGYQYVRGRLTNGVFVAGHWERSRSDGKLPDNSPPAVVSNLAASLDPDDMANAPAATAAEIAEFDQVRNDQLNIGVLGGETMQPIYYHNNEYEESVYKYNKVIDPAKLPGRFFEWASSELGWASYLGVRQLDKAVDLVVELKDWIFGSSSTKVNVDCWYPVSEYRKTVCGKISKDNIICPQDYMHTQVTHDKDVCFHLVPSARFSSLLVNRWTNKAHAEIEGEVRPSYLMTINTATGRTGEGLTPRNPVLMQVKQDESVCLYGPWMGDVLDINVKANIPLLDYTLLDLGDINLRKSNEIHPVNQFWKQSGKEWTLTAIADGTGYFEKKGGGEVEASGLRQRMRFYYAFILPPRPNPRGGGLLEFHVNGTGFDFTDKPAQEVAQQILTLKHNGTDRIRVVDNSLIRTQQTHRVFFDRVRKRSNGYLQGYLVVETEPIEKRGGSINLYIKDVSVNNGPVGTDPRPVLGSQ